jgi:hypothetical protein
MEVAVVVAHQEWEVVGQAPLVEMVVTALHLQFQVLL